MAYRNRTFNEYLRDPSVVDFFPRWVDLPTKLLILDWFTKREIVDEDNFSLYFHRQLSTSWRKYTQLLRIEPGQTYMDGQVEKVVTYDWLIEKYHELQRDTTESNSSSESSTGGSLILRSSMDEDTKTSTMSGVDVTDRDTSQTSQGTGSTSTSSEDHDQRDGSYSRDTTSSNVSDHDGENNDVTQSLGKTAPQSVSYSGTSGFPTSFDWTYPGTQGEDRHTGLEDSVDTSGTVSGEDGESSDTSSRTGASGTLSSNEQESAGAEDVNFDTSRLTDESGEKLGSSTEEAQNTGSKSGSGSRTGQDREISSGRDTKISEILEAAKDFILGSSAWDYLYKQLDKCFMSIYY